MILNSLFPVFALILTGYVLYRIGFPSRDFWPGVERITYFVLFPCLLFSTIALAPQGPLAAKGLSLAILFTVLAMAAFSLFLRPLAGTDGPGYTSLFQGVIRPNTYIALAAAAGLYGQEGLAAAAIALAVAVPLVNVLSVMVLAKHGKKDGGKGNFAVWAQVLKNPLILSALAGVAVNASGLVIPEAGVNLLKTVGRAALPMGLLAVGSGLRPREAAGKLRAVAAATGVKLLVSPLVCFALVGVLGVTGVEAKAAVVFTAVPASVSSYVLASQLGGDSELMAAILTLQTVAAAFTLPLVASLL